jgi:hypothetical protein
MGSRIHVLHRKGGGSTPEAIKGEGHKRESILMMMMILFLFCEHHHHHQDINTPFVKSSILNRTRFPSL